MSIIREIREFTTDGQIRRALFMAYRNAPYAVKHSMNDLDDLRHWLSGKPESEREGWRNCGVKAISILNTFSPYNRQYIEQDGWPGYA